MRLRPLAVLGALALAVAACAGVAPSPGGASAPRGAGDGAPPPGGIDLTVFAAASLADALAEARTAYAAAAPGTTLTISIDASSALATKIEQGAPADVFLAADTASAQRLVDGGLADGSSVAFAGNTLTIIVPADNPAAITTPADLSTPGVRIVAAGHAVPITRYAGQLVANLAALPGYPPDFAAAYEANVVSREDSVRAATAKVELGEGDAAIVYVTDVATARDVVAVPVPDTANVRATYAGVVVDGSPNAAAGHAFLAWLAGPGGRAVLAGFGFLPPP